jgi:hypothetical protein
VAGPWDRGRLCSSPASPGARPVGGWYSSRMSFAATAVLLFALAPAHPSMLPFIEDDYARGLAEARARNLPLFIEVWAPW